MPYNFRFIRSLLLGVALAPIVTLLSTGCSGSTIGLPTETNCIRQSYDVKPVERVLACDLLISKTTDPKVKAQGLIGRGNAHVFLNDRASAIADYTAAIELEPTNWVAIADRALAKDNAGDHAGAVLDASAAIRLAPEMAQPYDTRGNAKDALGLHAEAVEDYNEAIRLSPDYGLAYYNRGIAHEALAHHTAAISDFGTAANLRPQDAAPLVDRAVIYMADHRFDLALDDLNEAIRRDHDNVPALINRGTSLSKLNRPAEGLSDLDRAIMLEPSRAESYCFRRAIKLQMADEVGAKADMDTAFGLGDRVCGKAPQGR